MKSIRMPVDAAGLEEMAHSVTGGSLTQAPAALNCAVSLGQRIKPRAGPAWLAARHDPSTAQRHRPADLERIVALRRQRCTGQHIAHEVGVRRRR